MAETEPSPSQGRRRIMERLWAGWRASYVTGAAEALRGNGGDEESQHDRGAPDRGSGSVFRRILDSGLTDEEARIVWRGETVFAILNAYPYTSGHLLLMPYREVGELEDLTAEESSELWSATQDAVVAVKAAYRPHGVNVGLNLGEAAGAGVPSHLHIHVLPRWSADSNFMTAVAETRVLPEPLDIAWRKLKEAWPG